MSIAVKFPQMKIYTHGGQRPVNRENFKISSSRVAKWRMGTSGRLKLDILKSFLRAPCLFSRQKGMRENNSPDRFKGKCLSALKLAG